MESRIKYMNGADIVLEPDWHGNNYPDSVPRVKKIGAFGYYWKIFHEPPNGPGRLPFYEPAYKPYTTIKGIEDTTRVYVTRNPENGLVKVKGSSWIYGAYVMGVIPEEFGRIAWMRDDLTEEHWYNSLNKLTESANSMLVSVSLRDKYDLKVGDAIYIGLNAQSESLGDPS